MSDLSTSPVRSAFPLTAQMSDRYAWQAIGARARGDMARGTELARMSRVANSIAIALYELQTSTA